MLEIVVYVGLDWIGWDGMEFDKGRIALDIGLGGWWSWIELLHLIQL